MSEEQPFSYKETWKCSMSSWQLRRPLTLHFFPYNLHWLLCKDNMWMVWSCSRAPRTFGLKDSYPAPVSEPWWFRKCFWKASPSHKPQQLSSTAPGMCRKGCSLTAAEVRNTLRSGWQPRHESADSNIAVKRPYQPNGFPLVSFIERTSTKLGQTNSHFHFGNRAKSPSLIL